MEEKRYGRIYKATDNKIGKCYIGQTLQTLERRKYQHEQHALNKMDKTYTLTFYKAIRWLGVESFSWEILEDNIPLEELNKKEIAYIKEYNSYDDGYNSGPGGQMTHASKLTGEDVKAIRKMLTENLDMSLIQISEKIGKDCTKEMVSDINCGETWYDSNLSYPLRPMGFNKAINFSNETIKNIIEDIKDSSKTLTEISNKYGCHVVTIRKINEGISYKQEGISYPIRPKNYTKLDVNLKLLILDDLKNTNLSINELAEKYNVNRKIVSNINNGRYIDNVKAKRPNIAFPIRKNQWNANKK